MSGGKRKRCKFFPDCERGDRCQFYHPTQPCRFYPNCKFKATECAYIHPPTESSAPASKPAARVDGKAGSPEPVDSSRRTKTAARAASDRPSNTGAVDSGAAAAPLADPTIALFELHTRLHNALPGRNPSLPRPTMPTSPQAALDLLRTSAGQACHDLVHMRELIGHLESQLYALGNRVQMLERAPAATPGGAAAKPASPGLAPVSASASPTLLGAPTPIKEITLNADVSWLQSPPKYSRTSSGEDEEEVESEGLSEGEVEEDEDDEIDQEEGEGDEQSEGSWRDRFPFEENLFVLNQRCVFLERIHTNDDAVVYKGFDRGNTGSMVAIKIAEGLEADREPKEIHILAMLQGHPCVPKLLGWVPLPHTECYAVILQFYEAEDVIHVEKEKFPRIICDCLLALQHMHHHGVLYRDIKPSNTLYDKASGRGIVIDYDCATLYDAENLHRGEVGTEGYMAPELVAIAMARKNKTTPPERGYGYEVDIFSLGIMFGEMLFRIDDEGETSIEEFKRRVAAEHEKGPEYDLLLRMLEVEREKRITIEQALEHPYLAKVDRNPPPPPAQQLAFH